MSVQIKPVIKVIEDRCVNCHVCISVCPVKYCIDGSGDKVSINHELCIGCGACIRACSHKAREGVDDLEAFLSGLRRGEKMIAVVAPAVAARFPGEVLRLNGWLKSLGMAAIFDVAFGAELTVESYLNYVKTAGPSLVIAQPCPAIVSYIETFQPELLPYLAPADSPMLHTIKAALAMRPELRGHKIAVISPCVAKRREFDATGLGDYNLTLDKLARHMEEGKVRLADYPELGYDNPPAERAVLFSSPGGLKETVEREVPSLSRRIRKVEGPEAIYPYLRELPQALARKANPLILDCLNCEKGCNGGTGTGSQDLPQDVLEAEVSRRDLEQRELLSRGRFFRRSSERRVRAGIRRWWKPGLFTRTYTDRSAQVAIRHPDEVQLKSIYGQMAKLKEEDILNCGACGYGSCEGMATAVLNGLNKPENCQHFRQSMLEQGKESLAQMSTALDEEIVRSSALLEGVLSMLPILSELTDDQALSIKDANLRIGSLLSTLKQSSAISAERQVGLTSLLRTASGVQNELSKSLEAVHALKDQMGGIHDLVAGINKIASLTNLLSMNASIEAAHAGDSGKGFAVVAFEIRSLADQSGKSATLIAKTIADMSKGMEAASALTELSGSDIRKVLGDLAICAEGMKVVFDSMASMSSETDGISGSLQSLTAAAGGVRETYGRMEESLRGTAGEIAKIAQISRDNVMRTREAEQRTA